MYAMHTHHTPTPHHYYYWRTTIRQQQKPRAHSAHKADTHLDSTLNKRERGVEVSKQLNLFKGESNGSSADRSVSRGSQRRGCGYCAATDRNTWRETYVKSIFPRTHWLTSPCWPWYKLQCVVVLRGVGDLYPYMPLAPAPAYHVVLEPDIIIGQFREFEPPRVDTQLV